MRNGSRVMRNGSRMMRNGSRGIRDDSRVMRKGLMIWWILNKLDNWWRVERLLS